MRIIKLFLLLMILFLLQACLETRNIEEAAIINTRGVDLIEEGGGRMVETTIVPYIFDPSAPEMTNMLVGRGHTIKEARDDAGKQSPYFLSPGKISVEFFGKEAAEAGILPFLNTLVRDARVSDIMQLAVTNQTARELLELEQHNVKTNQKEYLEDLISKEVEIDTLPQNTLEYFTRLAEQIGIDPILPVIDIVDDRPTLTTAAVFKNDQYVGEISLKESFMINQLRKTVAGTSLEVNVPPENYQDLVAYDGEIMKKEDSIYITLILNRGKGRIDIVDSDSLAYQADISMEVQLLETSVPMDIKTKEASEKLERDIEKYFVKGYENLFTKLQEFHSDAFGLGRIYTATRQGSKTTDKEWREMYEEATMEFNVDVTIINYGAID